MTNEKPYYVLEYRPGRWHVIAPDGLPIYDGGRYGDDKPIIFTDEDAAIECAQQCNLGLEEGEHDHD